MKQDARAKNAAFRRAVWASIALHGVVGCALLLFLQFGEERKPAQPGIDTRAASEPQVHITFADADPVSVALPPSETAPGDAKPPDAPPTPSLPTLPTGPIAPAAPRTLPAELIALVRKPGPTSITPTTTEGPTGGMAVTPTDPTVRPAGGGASGPARAIHGALAPGKTVVYVLDCSGSMGAAGKLDAARTALAATLRHQPPTVRFQVIAYAGTAAPLLATNGTALPASEANVRAAVEKLSPLEARGKSNHPDAVRVALTFRPDVILVLTDADDLSAAALAPLFASVPEPVSVCVGQVTAEGVQRPRELK